MHYLMLATLAMDEGNTSLDARQQAMDFLLADDSFCGEGGRWSGMLKKTLLGDAYKAAFHQEFPEMASGHFPALLVDKHRDALNQLWQRFGGTGAHPDTRSSYDHLGCDDDAMIVNQALYDHFLARDPSQHCETFADLDDEPVNETFIGHKWLVVVDYHN